jgi:hypothetical protein
LNQHPKFFTGYFGQLCNNFIHFVTLSPHNTCIAFPKFSLVFCANYVRTTSIIVKLHFAALASCNTQNVFPNSSLGFLVHYAILGPKMSTVMLTNYVIFVYLHVFPIQNSFICEYACVMFDMCFWHDPWSNYCILNN